MRCHMLLSTTYYETNYIMTTVNPYVAIFNLFTSLLHLPGGFNSNE